MFGRMQPGRETVLRGEKNEIGRRGFLLIPLAAGLAAGTARAEDAAGPAPIVFVHGNGDTAGLWLTTLWRFESNGTPRERMFALDLRYPTARTRDDTPQAGRSSTADVMQQLAAEVSRVRRLTGAPKVILVAQSRGGNTVRNYLENGGGAEQASMAVLCGAVNHGVIVSDKYLVGSEFNGASPFMRDLNATPGEVVPGVRFATIRSDHNDKFAQPDGRYLGLPGVRTGISFDAPDLAGARKFILPGVDHRETGYSPDAFATMFGFIAGGPPRTQGIVAEARPVLTGKVSTFEAGAPTNIGIAGATLEVFEVAPGSGERRGGPVHRKTTAADGMWGDFAADPKAAYEIVLTAPGYPVTHFYRSAFPRSSAVVNLRPQPFQPEDKSAGAVVYMTRPRGYFGIGRDRILLDGRPPAGVPAGVPSVSSARVAVAANGVPVPGVFNDETIGARTWPARDGHVSVIELTH